MSTNEFNVKGIKLTIIEKPEHKNIWEQQSALQKKRLMSVWRNMNPAAERTKETLDELRAEKDRSTGGNHNG